MRVLVWSLLLVASSCSAGDTPGCDALSPEARAALSAWVAGVYGGRGQIDGESTETQRKQIIGYGRKILPCLVTLYREGPAAAGLWKGKEPSPPNARWSLNLITAIDSDTAITLLNEWRTESGTDNLTRSYIDTRLGRLGDGAALGRLAQFLDTPPTATGGDPKRLRDLREDAMETVALRNYRPALAGLKRLAVWDGRPASKFWHSTLQIYIAQLSGDIPALTRYAHDPECFSWALEAFAHMGRYDLLRTLAGDSDYRFQGAAMALVALQPGDEKTVK